jgi:hypothetical protein
MLLALGALLLAQPAFADPVGDLAADVDSFWLILGGAMVFFMHAGFALLVTGSVSMRNTQNILFKVHDHPPPLPAWPVASTYD